MLRFTVYHLDPINIGRDVNSIIPSGNVINDFIFRAQPLPSDPPPTEDPGKRQIEEEGEGEEPPLIVRSISCFSTRGYENPVWLLPDDTDALSVFNVSLYETQLNINLVLIPTNFISRITCSASNGLVNSSIIVTLRKC